MTYYIDFSDIQSCFNVESIERTTDELSSGASNKKIVDDIIVKAEATFEGYAKKQIQDLTSLRAAKPEQAQSWITDLVVYRLFKRNGAAPAEIRDQYLMTIQEMKDYAKTGIPDLISTPQVSAGSQHVAHNMTEEDLEVMPWESENIKSVWKGTV